MFSSLQVKIWFLKRIPSAKWPSGHQSPPVTGQQTEAQHAAFAGSQSTLKLSRALQGRSSRVSVCVWTGALTDSSSGQAFDWSFQSIMSFASTGTVNTLPLLFPLVLYLFCNHSPYRNELMPYIALFWACVWCSSYKFRMKERGRRRERVYFVHLKIVIMFIFKLFKNSYCPGSSCQGLWDSVIIY